MILLEAGVTASAFSSPRGDVALASEKAGLPLPDRLEGTSLVPLLNDPNTPWSRSAISKYPTGGRHGTAIRTDRCRYVEWYDKSGKLADRELYDHQTDPQEDQNVAGKPENRAVIDRLAAELEASRAARKAR